MTTHRQYDGRLFRSFARSRTDDDLSQTLDDQLTHLLRTAIRRLRALQLTDTETTILKALLLFCTGILARSHSFSCNLPTDRVSK